MINSVQKVIADVSKKCLDNKISFKLINKRLVDIHNLPCSGYFDEDSLVVATNKKNSMCWVSTLLHESCHMDQFLQKSKYYVSDIIGLDVVEGWIAKQDMSENKLLKGFYNTIGLELDCEKRTVRKIKKYKLPINIEKYIQEANAYLFAYVYSLLSRKWYEAPYEKKNIVEHMPTKFLTIDKYFIEYKNYRKFYE